jgi:hypothetical protein
MRRLALLVFALTLLAPALAAGGAPPNEQGGAKAEKKQAKPEKKQEAKKNKAVPVPEPTTLALLGAAAGVAGVHRLRQSWNRKRDQ